MRDPLFSIVVPCKQLRRVVRRFLILHYDEPELSTFNAAITGYNLIGWLYAGRATGWFNGHKLPWIDAPTLHADGVLYDEDVHVMFEGPFGQIFIEFTATGFYELTGISGEKYAGSGVILDIEQFPAGQEIFALMAHSAAHAQPDMADALCAQLERTLVRMLPNCKPVPDYIRKAVAAIEECDGNIQLASLMKDIPVTPQHFSRYFKYVVGLSPKKWAKVLKMNKALGALIAEDGMSLTTAAHDAGYFDQPHFTRAVRDLMHISPGRLVNQNDTVVPEFIGRPKVLTD